MKKNQFLISVISLVVLMVIGVLFISYPKYVLNTMYYGIGIALFLLSVSCIIYFLMKLNQEEKFKYYMLVFGIIGIILAGLIIIEKNALASVLNIFIGLAIVVINFISIGFTIKLKEFSKNYLVTGFINIVNILLGIVLIVKPFSLVFLSTESIGLILFITSLLNIIMMLIFKINLPKEEKIIVVEKSEVEDKKEELEEKESEEIKDTKEKKQAKKPKKSKTKKEVNKP